MRFICIQLSSLSGMLLMVFLACTLDKESDIPAGVSNEINPVFASTDFEQVGAHSVRARAFLSSFGNLNIQRYGWVWSENPNPTLQDNKQELDILALDSFSIIVNGLYIGKKYHFRPYVITGSVETYGQDYTYTLIPTFQKSFDLYFSVGRVVRQTADSGFILLGHTEGLRRMQLMKTNASGDILWSKFFGETDDEYSSSMEITSDGGFILLGYKIGVDHQNIHLIKTTPSGDLQWERFLGEAGFVTGSSVKQTSDGGFVVLGNSYTEDLALDSIYLAKTNALGNLEWERTFGGGDDKKSGSSVQQTSDGGFAILGSSIQQENMYLLKTDAFGNPVWEKYYGGIKPNLSAYLQPITNGGFILLGTKYISDFNGNIYIAKINSSGDLEWEKIFEKGGIEEGNSVQQTTDGGFIILGSTNSSNLDGFFDMYLIKIDTSGNLQWNKQFSSGKTYDDFGFSVQQTIDGGFILFGTAINLEEVVYKMFLVKTDKNGNVY